MWRANACPLWLFALLASQLVWNGMGQALAFLRVLVLGLGDILTFCSPLLFLKCLGGRQVTILDESLEVKGYPVFGGPVLVPLLPS